MARHGKRKNPSRAGNLKRSLKGDGPAQSRVLAQPGRAAPLEIELRNASTARQAGQANFGDIKFRDRAIFGISAFGILMHSAFFHSRFLFLRFFCLAFFLRGFFVLDIIM
jgi:hypothetical protein